MNELMKKSLTDLIDETLMELEELKKSRFSAAEIKIEGPGDGIAGKPSDGKLDAAKAEDEKDEKEEDEKDKEEKAEKSEDDPADSEEVKRKLKELGKADKDESKKDKEEKDDDKDEDKEEKADEKKPFGKSEEEVSSLMKSLVDERVKPLEDKLSAIFDLVNKIADQPVTPKGATARTVPLMKSADDVEVEALSKAQVASKLFDLKKSGTPVDSLDITKADLGQDLEQIVKKYKIS